MTAGAARAGAAVAGAAGVAAAGAAVAGAAGATGAGALAEGADQWSSILAATDLTGAARQLASNCVLLGRQGSVVRLGLDPKNKFMRTPSQEEKLAQALSRYFGETVRVEFEMKVAGPETPHQAQQRSSQEELDSARRAFEADPGVQGLRERFGATLLPDTVRPAKS